MDNVVELPFGPESPKQEMILESEAEILVIGGAAGCYTADTEFLTPNGWVKFKDYSKELHKEVAEYNLTKDALEYRTTKEYVKLPCEEFKSISNSSFSMTLSDEHKVLSFKNYAPQVQTFLEYLEDKDRGKIKGAVGNTYYEFNQDSVITEVESEDGYKYCFTTTTGYLPVRQNGKVFISGNSGKSYLLQMLPLAVIDDPMSSIIMFRRTTPQIKGLGGLFDTARNMYSQLPKELIPKFRDQAAEAIFPSGAKMKWSHMENVKDKINHQGLQYTLVGFDEG